MSMFQTGVAFLAGALTQSGVQAACKQVPTCSSSEEDQGPSCRISVRILRASLQEREAYSWMLKPRLHVDATFAGTTKSTEEGDLDSTSYSSSSSAYPTDGNREQHGGSSSSSSRSPSKGKVKSSSGGGGVGSSSRSGSASGVSHWRFGDSLTFAVRMKDLLRGGMTLKLISNTAVQLGPVQMDMHHEHEELGEAVIDLRQQVLPSCGPSQQQMQQQRMQQQQQQQQKQQRQQQRQKQQQQQSAPGAMWPGRGAGRLGGQNGMSPIQEEDDTNIVDNEFELEGHFGGRNDEDDHLNAKEFRHGKGGKSYPSASSSSPYRPSRFGIDDEEWVSPPLLVPLRRYRRCPLRGVEVEIVARLSVAFVVNVDPDLLLSRLGQLEQPLQDRILGHLESFFESSPLQMLLGCSCQSSKASEYAEYCRQQQEQDQLRRDRQLSEKLPQQQQQLQQQQYRQRQQQQSLQPSYQQEEPPPPPPRSRAEKLAAQAARAARARASESTASKPKSMKTMKTTAMTTAFSEEPEAEAPTAADWAFHL